MKYERLNMRNDVPKKFLYLDYNRQRSSFRSYQRKRTPSFIFKERKFIPLEN